MKKTLVVLIYLWLGISLAGCTSLRSLKQAAVSLHRPTNVAPLPVYSGPKARIAVSDFEVKAAKASGEMGGSLRQMLVTNLVNSRRFSVIERQDLAAADLIIAAAVSEFEPEASGGRAGMGGGGGVGSGVLGSLLGSSLNKAHIALDIRIVATTTSEVLAARRIEGQASDIEKAIHICIIEAVRYISQTTSADYYKY